MTIPHMISETSITFYVKGRPYQVSRQSMTYGDIVAELRNPNPNQDRLVELADVSRKIAREVTTAFEATEVENMTYLTKGVITVDREGVKFNGEPLVSVLADRMMDVLHAGLPLAPWIRFAENLFMNPAEHAREELFLWLEKADLPITEDGHFLAYKRVRNDFRDLHTGTFDNSPGQLVQMKREEVDPVRDRTCSRGLHFCSKAYLPHFGAGEGNTIVLVKINPADVVSIPSDYDNTKGRTWRYEVVDQIPYEEVVDRRWAPIVSTWTPSDEDEVEEDDTDDDGPSVLSVILAFRDAGYADREDRLDRATEILGWTVGSFNELDGYDLTELLEAIKDEANLGQADKIRALSDQLFNANTITSLRGLVAKAARDKNLIADSVWVWKQADKRQLADALAKATVTA